MPPLGVAFFVVILSGKTKKTTFGFGKIRASTRECFSLSVAKAPDKVIFQDYENPKGSREPRSGDALREVSACGVSEIPDKAFFVVTLSGTLALFKPTISKNEKT